MLTVQKSCPRNRSLSFSYKEKKMSTPQPPKGHFNVLYFASAGSFTSKNVEALPAPLPLGKLFSALEERYSGITEAVLQHCLVTVNLAYVEMPEGNDEGEFIQEGDEVAIIPPVSSG